MHHLGYATMRFNFRGVGRSAGAWNEGIGETDDAEVAVPVGYAVVHGDELEIPFNAADLDALPPAPGDHFERDEEVDLRIALDRVLSGGRTFSRPDFRSAA